MSRFLSFIESAAPQTVRVRDRAGLAEKVEKLMKAGLSSLQLVSDFDQTLTRVLRNDGSRNPTSHGVIETTNLLSHSYHESVQNLRSRYFPIEIDPHLTREQKIPLMEEWWRLAHDELIKAGMNKTYLSRMVETANLQFRHGVLELLERLSAHQIPLLVFSAGLGDVIEACLSFHFKNLHKDNTFVISNRMTFDETGRAIGFSGQTMHVFNKGEFHLDDGSPFANKIQNRHNVILLGDGLGDLQMADSLTTEVVLSIGFLNDRVAERLESYLNAYDVVILHDGEMDIVNLLIDDIVTGL